MPESKLTKEELAEDLRALLRGSLQRTGPRWLYCEAAAVLSYFDLNEIRPLGGVEYRRKEALESLLPDSEVVYGEDRRPQWRLRAEVRKQALKRLWKAGRLEEALNTNPRPADTLQEMLDAYLLGRPPDLGRQTRQQLLAISQVSEWLQDLGIKGVPDPKDVHRRLELDSLFEPFRFLVGDHFQGRESELKQLTEHVRDVPRGILRSLFGRQDNPILFIYGPGGIGKSTLLAKFILNCEASKDRERIFFTYLDFDRPSLSAQEPLTLLLEALRQLAIQYPESSVSLESKREQWKRSLSDPKTERSRGGGEDKSSRLTLVQFESLCRAFLDAYTPETLERMLLFRLDKRLYHVVPVDRTFEETVYRVVADADMHMWAADLIRAALLDKPGNPRLHEFVRRYPEFNPARVSFRQEDRQFYLRDFAEEIKSLTLGESPFLLILDTFEEVQTRSRVFVEQIFAFLSDLGELIPNFKTILSGRAEVSPADLERFEQERLKKLAISPMPLNLFDPDAAQGFLGAQGVTEPAFAAKIVGAVGGMPLKLKLAAELLARELTEGNDIKDPKFQERFLKAMGGRVTQSQLYTRILEHIRDPDVKLLVHPGLILRRITPELILHVLAGPCGVKVDTIEDAQKLFDKLRAEVALVTQVGEKELAHRPDLRGVMIEMLRRDAPDKVRQIHLNAVRYYEDLDDDVSRAEELYHRLSLGLDRKELEARWREGLDLPADVVRELPPKAQAYLAARLNVEIEEEYWAEADLEDWELYAARRVRELLNTSQPVKALKALRQRAERTPDSPLVSLELEALIDAVAGMQNFFTVYRDVTVTRSSADELYEAIIWCLNHYELGQGSESYIRGNLSATGAQPPLPGDPLSGVPSLVQLFEEKITKPQQASKARGGEVEFALRSLLEILRRGELKVETQAMLSEMRRTLVEIVSEFERQVAATS